MDKEIKRLLWLKTIPGFKLSKKEEELLESWKKIQEPVEIVKPKRTYTRRKKTTNEVKEKEKETGEIENITSEE